MSSCSAGVGLGWAMRFGKRQNPQLCELSKVLRCGPADRRGARHYAERRKVELVFTGTESPLGRLDWPTSATENTEWRFWGEPGRSSNDAAHKSTPTPIEWSDWSSLSLSLSLPHSVWCALGNTHTHTHNLRKGYRGCRYCCCWIAPYLGLAPVVLPLFFIHRL